MSVPSLPRRHRPNESTPMTGKLTKTLKLSVRFDLPQGGFLLGLRPIYLDIEGEAGEAARSGTRWP